VVSASRPVGGINDRAAGVDDCGIIGSDDIDRNPVGRGAMPR
jgi:hypothetical protein